jgi:hypothetical protein
VPHVSNARVGCDETHPHHTLVHATFADAMLLLLGLCLLQRDRDGLTKTGHKDGGTKTGAASYRAVTHGTAPGCHARTPKYG